MKKQIIHLSVHQTSKVIAAMHAAMITVLFYLPMALGAWLQGRVISGLFLLIVFPLVTWLLLYIGFAIACWFYNLFVSWFGGIELELADVVTKEEKVPPELLDKS